MHNNNIQRLDSIFIINAIVTSKKVKKYKVGKRFIGPEYPRLLLLKCLVIIISP